MLDFWSRVSVLNPEDCWPWLKGKANNGYGRYTKAKRSGMPSGAHQVSWILTYGNIPHGLYVLHKCDNPGCVNPYHLFLGTAKDNALDKVSKNRQPRGEQISSHKLTSLQVKQIKEDTRSTKDIAKAYNVSSVLIFKIKRNESWRHI